MWRELFKEIILESIVYLFLKNLNQILQINCKFIYIDLHELKVNCEYVSRRTDLGFAFV